MNKGCSYKYLDDNNKLCCEYLKKIKNVEKNKEELQDIRLRGHCVNCFYNSYKRFNKR